MDDLTYYFLVMNKKIFYALLTINFLIVSGGAFATSDSVHCENVGLDYSKWFPSNYWHNAWGGPENSNMFPPGHTHNQIEGPDYTFVFPSGYQHNNEDGPEKSQMFPGDYQHNNEEGPEKSQMFPPGHQHNDREGQHKSRMFPADYEHNNVDGPVKSCMYPPGWKHNDKEGDHKSHVFPPNFWHNDKEGHFQSWMFPPSMKHNDIDGPDKSYVFDTSYVHYTQGHRQSRMLPPMGGDNGKFRSVKAEASETNAPSTLDVFPNPAVGVVTISPVFVPKFVQHVEVRLVGMDGKQVLSQQLNNVSNNQVKLDLSALSKGVYFGSVLMEGEVVNIFKVTK